ncbi:hypothetical protein J6590_006649 [Homalodisca vitripennis]|nr:hypothetical protein J6590_006649 [Homalodisca vitripennis]
MVPRCVTLDYSSNRHPAITAPDARYLVMYVFNGCDKEHCLHISSRPPSDTMAISRELSEITSSREQTPLQWFLDMGYVQIDLVYAATVNSYMVGNCKIATWQELIVIYIERETAMSMTMQASTKTFMFMRVSSWMVPYSTRKRSRGLFQDEWKL